MPVNRDSGDFLKSECWQRLHSFESFGLSVSLRGLANNGVGVPSKSFVGRAPVPESMHSELFRR